MNLYLWPVVIFLTAVTVLLGVGWLLGRGNRQLDRIRLLGQHGVGQVELEQGYGPFPADTGPLLLLSEKAAAVDAHEREIQAMIRQAQRLGMMP